jgi:gamma-glutamylcyclotransferase (GGCT)/AIG2-like uncharacterized protein YtfP
MKDYLFVYGTLKHEFAPPEISVELEKLKYVGDGFIYGRLYDLGQYPGVVSGRGIREKVFGRIYEIPSAYDESLLAKLDDYEEYYRNAKGRSLFVRRRVNVYRPNREPLRTWAYLYNKDVKPSQRIKSGHYREVSA